MHYAVNVGDLTMDKGLGAGISMTSILLAPVCSGKLTVDAEKGKVDGAALVLECDETRALAICEVLRMGFKRKGLVGPRCYRSVTGNGGWRRFNPKAIIGGV